MKKELEIKKYGRLQAIKETNPEVKEGKGRRRIRRRLLCVCDCGKEGIYKVDDLNSGKTRSCGCYKIDTSSVSGREIGLGYSRAITHGMTDSRIYKIWCGIVTRTTNKNRDRVSERYVNRGIKNEFKSFEHFLETMGPTYKKGLSIERNENDGNYSPENCSWATTKEQNRNTSQVRWVEYNGERFKMREMCEKLGINYNTARSRLDQMGWSIEAAFGYRLK